MDLRPIVTLCDPGDLGYLVSKNFSKRLLFSNIIWKNPMNQLRTIDNLNVKVLPFEDKLLSSPGVLKRHSDPILHVYIFQCDDVDVYKFKFKSQISSWSSKFQDSNRHDWMVIQVTEQDPMKSSRGQMAKFSFKSTVLDRLRSDFGKQDKCIQVYLSDEHTKKKNVEVLMGTLLELILSSFNRRIGVYEEDIKSMLSNRHMPGWNYCNFFVMKEELAFSFEMMGLKAESLVQYDELDSILSQIEFQKLEYGSLPWMEWFPDKNGARENAYVAITNLLDVNKKKYRELIQQNTITIFDMRVYLFARSCQILLGMNRPVQVLQRAYVFILSMAVKLRKQTTVISSDFIHIWSFSACRQVLKRCLEAKKLLPKPLDDEDSSKFYNLCTQLCHLAFKKLTALGVAHYYLPKVHPFCFLEPSEEHVNNCQNLTKVPSTASGSCPTSPLKLVQQLSIGESQSVSSVRDKLVQPTLLRANSEPSLTEYVVEIQDNEMTEILSSKNTFYQAYIDTASECSSFCSTVSRPRLEVSLKVGLGHVYILLEKYEDALKCFREACENYVEDGWTTLEYCTRLELIKLQRELNDIEGLIKSSLFLCSKSSLCPSTQRVIFFADVKSIVSGDIKRVDCSFSPCFRISDPSLFKHTVRQNGETYDSVLQPLKQSVAKFTIGEKVKLNFCLESYLPSEVQLDSITVVFRVAFSGKKSQGNSGELEHVGTEEFKKYSVFGGSTGDASETLVKVDKDSLSLKVNNFLCTPGVNEICFSCQALHEGIISFERVIARLGKLRFVQVLKRKELQQLHVGRGKPQVAISLLNPDFDPFFVGCEHEIQVEIRTEKDTPSAAKIEIASDQGIQILPSHIPLKMKANGKEEVKSLELRSNRMELPACESYTVLTFPIFFLALDKDSFTHNFSVCMTYEKTPGEVFQTCKSFDLQFCAPFATEFDFVACPNKYFLSCKLTNRSDVVVEIGSYVAQVEKESNGWEVKNSVELCVGKTSAEKNDALSFSFEIENNTNEAWKVLQLAGNVLCMCTFRKQSTESQSAKKLVWNFSLPFNVLASKPSIFINFEEYRVDRIWYIGCAKDVCVTFHLEECVANDVKAEFRSFMYNVDVEDPNWFVCGKSRSSVDFSRSNTVTIRLTLIPLVNGRLSYPGVSIESTKSLGKCMVLCNYEGVRIDVYSAPHYKVPVVVS
eukprot:Nk52_evm39s215 gene=Nk52_evmTU39s215